MLDAPRPAIRGDISLAHSAIGMRAALATVGWAPPGFTAKNLLDLLAPGRSTNLLVHTTGGHLGSQGRPAVVIQIFKDRGHSLPRKHRTWINSTPYNYGWIVASWNPIEI